MNGAGRAVAACLVLSIVAALALGAVYVAGGQPQVEGALLAMSLGGFGVGLMVWSVALMPEIRDETHPRPARQLESKAAVDADEAGVDEIRRRTMLARLLVAALGAMGLAAVFPIRSLGQAPGDDLERTAWRAGKRLVGADGAPITSATLVIGSAITVFPEGFAGSADAQAVLVKVEPALLSLPEGRERWSAEGLVAYSKICTHAGCPVGLYLAQTHELRCPCHQSTFNVLNGAEPVYGPAARPLPQLPLEIDAGGAVVATGDFSAPVGPAFWDLG